MDYFSCKVRLSGSVLNEVPRVHVSAPEVIMLRHIHGGDAIVDLKRIAQKNTQHDIERNRLAQMYTDKRVFELFGPVHRELPTKVPGYSDEPAPVISAENMAPIEEPAAGLMA